MEFKVGTFGISSEGPRSVVVGNRNPSEATPSSFYVYGHCDGQGNLFYVGKGSGRRAWSDDRHPLWTRYVTKHLDGHYAVQIIADAMTEDQAERLEDSLITEHGATLVNWINFGRETDFKAMERFHALRDANRKLVAETRALEATLPDKAIANYRVAVARIAEYAFIQSECGLVGKLLAEEAEETGVQGDVEALDRLTLCLCKQGLAKTARDEADYYFGRYRRDTTGKAAEKIMKRIEKAVGKF